MTFHLHAAAALALVSLVSCADTGRDPSGSQVSRLQQTAPTDAEPGTCWGQDVTPAVIETVTSQVLVAPDGSETDDALPVYHLEAEHVIVEERSDYWFQTPCPDVMDAEFVSSLQRALAVRDFYRGPVTGELDAATRNAIRKYQKQRGLASNQLSLDAAQALGLVAVPRPDPDASTTES